jgi:Xaa-Pro aminopeptidase
MAKKLSAHTVAFQKLLKPRKVDAYWVTHVPDIFYLSGFGCEATWALIGSQHATLIVPGLALDQAKVLAPGYEVLALKKAAESFQLVKEMAAKRKWKTIGYDPYHVTEAYILAMRKATGDAVLWQPMPSATTAIRIKKDKAEIKALREAGRLVAEGFNHIQRIARPGMSESDLAADFESYIRKNGATKTSFDSIVAFGENAAFPHYITGNRILRKNDIVLCDIGALVDGYCSDLTRTFFMGKMTALGQKVYSTVDRAQKLAMAAVKPGVKTAQIDRIARDEIERAGYGRRFIHSTGHGVGVEIHEAPWVGPTSTDTLEPGMIITVEPGIYLQGWGGVRIEDTLLVTSKGYEVLTKA